MYHTTNSFCNRFILMRLCLFEEIKNAHILCRCKRLTLIRLVYQKGAENVGLLPDIDENATVSQVRHFLRDDDKLPRLERLSGAWCELKSPTMDITGVHGSGAGNATENRYVMHAYYYAAYQAVTDTINYLSHDSQLIIRKKYLEGEPNWQVAQMIGVASTQFGKRDRKACFEFADCLQGLADSRGLKEFDLDLHVYKTNKKTGELPAKERQKTGH